MATAIRFCLGHLLFAWDAEKAEANVRTHGISFEEAATTWLDPLAIERFDEEHSDSEDRWLRIGSSLRGALLVVWSTERDIPDQTVIRIIGTRRTNRRERDLYEGQSKRR
ncbi:MAG TPA: BrnT family toxin [Thermoanaerobaculia bacterium]|nr:BrnT family toxin [Thermoanaerobaculia bacterium]